MTSVERRIFLIGTSLTTAGAVIGTVVFGMREGLSFLFGGALGGASLAWLRGTVGSLMLRDRRGSITRVIVSFMLRLLLIPLCLYAMIRFLYGGLIAAVAGFAVFNCSIFVEGVYEALKGSGKDARTE